MTELDMTQPENGGVGTIDSLVKVDGVAGQVQYVVTASWASGTHTHSFLGTEYGAPGPVFLIVKDQPVLVYQPERFGVRFDESWVRAFYRGANDGD